MSKPILDIKTKKNIEVYNKRSKALKKTQKKYYDEKRDKILKQKKEYYNDKKLSDEFSDYLFDDGDKKIEKINDPINEKLKKAHDIVFLYGKYKGLNLYDIYQKDKRKGLRYINWMCENYKKQYEDVEYIECFLDKYYFVNENQNGDS